MHALKKWVLAAAMLAFSLNAAADIERCIDASTDIDTVLEAVINGQNATLKFVQGVYVVYSTRLNALNAVTYSGNLTLLGGYTDNTCTARVVDATNTVLREGYGVSFPIAGNLLIEGIEFKANTNGVQVLILSELADSAQSVIVRRSIFDGAATATCSPNCSDLGGLAIEKNHFDHSASVRISNSLIYGNTAFAGLNLYDHQGATLGATLSMTLLDNTIVDNSNRGISVLAHKQVVAYNNVVFSNGSTGLYIDANANAGPLLVDNTIGSTDTPTPDAASVGSLSTNPQFVDAPNADYRLKSTSTAINSGENDPPGSLSTNDLDGGARLIGSRVDRGAYESAVNDLTVLTVVNSNDSGGGSLRAAINTANNNSGSHDIEFAIPGGCVNRIDLASPLPDITNPLRIKGFTQPGASANTLENSDNAVRCIRINGGNVDHALRVPAVTSVPVSLTVSGIAFGSFSGSAIDLKGGADHVVRGNYFGDGLPMLAKNAINIQLSGVVGDSRIGGGDPADRNVILGATTAGVLLGNGTHDNTVQNNFIGLLPSDDGADANLVGVHLLGQNTTLQDNYISGNTTYGVEIDGAAASGNSLIGNAIGLYAVRICAPPQCVPATPNGSDGVMVENGAHENALIENVIEYNTRDGVRITGGIANAMHSNTIYANGGLGIDLGGDGVSANDNDGGTIGSTVPNRLVNFPVIATAAGIAKAGTVTGTLSSANGSYKIEVYTSPTCDSSSHGEGQLYLKGVIVTISNATAGQNGSVPFSIGVTNFSLTSLIGQAITATSTDSLGNTSEFASCAIYTDDVIFANGFQ